MREQVLGSPQSRRSLSLTSPDNVSQTSLCKRITLLKHRLLSLNTGFSDSVTLRLSPRICIANSLPGDTASITSLGEPLLYSNCSQYSIYSHQKEYSLRYLHYKIVPLQSGSEYIPEKKTRMTKS